MLWLNGSQCSMAVDLCHYCHPWGRLAMFMWLIATVPGDILFSQLGVTLVVKRPNAPDLMLFIFITMFYSGDLLFCGVNVLVIVFWLEMTCDCSLAPHYCTSTHSDTSAWIQSLSLNDRRKLNHAHFHSSLQKKDNHYINSYFLRIKICMKRFEKNIVVWACYSRPCQSDVFFRTFIW